MIKSSKFQAHGAAIRHVFIASRVHHPQLDFFLSPPMRPSLPAHLLPAPPPHSGDRKFTVPAVGCGSPPVRPVRGCLQVYIPHVSDVMWFSTFSVRLISLSVIISRSCHVVTRFERCVCRVQNYKLPTGFPQQVSFRWLRFQGEARLPVSVPWAECVFLSLATREVFY